MGRIPRHEWPGRIVFIVGLAMSLSCVTLLIVLPLGQAPAMVDLDPCSVPVATAT